MKNPLILFLGQLKANISSTEIATLEFCYDHITEDFSDVQQDRPQLSQQSDSQPLGIQEAE